MIAGYLEPGWHVLDPFAGVGRIHELRDLVEDLTTLGIEIEPEWAALHPSTWVGNSLELPLSWTDRWDAVVTSVTYGNRFSDHHKAKDPCKLCAGRGWQLWALDETVEWRLCKSCKGKGLSKRRSYTHSLGRDLHPDNSGQLPWGPGYWDFHKRAYAELWRVLRPATDDRPPGRFILNVSDFYKDKARVRAVRWHLETCEDLGFELIGSTAVSTRRQRHGANRERVDYEQVLVFEKAA